MDIMWPMGEAEDFAAFGSASAFAQAFAAGEDGNFRNPTFFAQIDNNSAIKPEEKLEMINGRIVLSDVWMLAPGDAEAKRDDDQQQQLEAVGIRPPTKVEAFEEAGGTTTVLMGSKNRNDDGDAHANSSCSEYAGPARDGGIAGPRKRKGPPDAGKGLAKPDSSATSLNSLEACDNSKVTELRNVETNAKRPKAAGAGTSGTVKAKVKAQRSAKKHSGDSSARFVKARSKPPETPKKQDYVHVRARRGQATDRHSLAERLRREKISGRMKFLQELVPGCSKITGRAMMLDEIINYVQALQRQIESLSMKLSALSSELHFNMDHLFNKEVAPSQSPETTMMGPEPTVGCGDLCPQLQVLRPWSLDYEALQTACEEFLRRWASAPLRASLLLSPIDFEGPLTQVASEYEGHLQSLVQMGFSQGTQGLLTHQGLHVAEPGLLPPGYFNKTEL